MLLLTRKPGETINIGPDIRVVVLRQSRSGEVTLGIEAPAEVKILRGELLPRDSNAGD